MASVQLPPPTIPAEQVDEVVDSHQLRKSCDYCVRMKRGCDGGTPCELCKRRSKDCIRSVKKRSGPAKGTKYSKRRTRKNSNSKALKTSSSCPAAVRAAAAGGGAASADAAAAATSTFTKTPSGSPVARRPLPASSTRDDKKAARARISRAAPVPTTAVHIKHEAIKHTPPPDIPLPPSAKVTPDKSVVTPAFVVSSSMSAGLVEPERSVGQKPAPVLDAPQARWREPRAKAVDGSSGSGDRRSVEAEACGDGLLPFYFAPNEILVGSDDAAWGEDASPRAGAGGGAFVGSNNGGESQQAAARIAAAAALTRRSSLEEALYGSCFKRSSFNAWTPSVFHSQPQTLEIGGKDVLGLLWNKDLPADGAAAAGAGVTEQGGFRPSESFPPTHTPASVYQGGGFGLAEPQSDIPPPVSMPFDNGGGSAIPSLRDLLLDKWPPAPLNELSMAEYTL